MRWRPDGGTAHHGEFWRLFIEGALRYPWTWLTSGGEATSTWIPPGGTEMTPEQGRQRLADLATNRLGPTAGSYLELLSRFDAAHPRAEPHYYLSLLGTHPDHRGKGIGMRLLAHDLEQIGNLPPMRTPASSRWPPAGTCRSTVTRSTAGSSPRSCG